MSYFFPDFDENIRTIMYQELLDDIESNNFFKPSSMLDSVVNCYQTILKETFLNQNFEYLSKTLNSCFLRHLQQLVVKYHQTLHKWSLLTILIGITQELY